MNTYVYAHIRLDTLKIFYIGIGKTKNRAYTTYGRNIHWHRIVNKTNYFVDKLFENLTWEEACNIEKTLIKSIGRINLKTGTLCNMTDGGDGIVNYRGPNGETSSRSGAVLSDYTKDLMRKSALKRASLNPKKIIVPPDGYKFKKAFVKNLCDMLLYGYRYKDINKIYSFVTPEYLVAVRKKKIRKNITNKYNFPIPSRKGTSRFKVINKPELMVYCPEINVIFKGVKSFSCYFKINYMSAFKLLKSKKKRFTYNNKIYTVKVLTTP
jgi:hypothetical protein